MNYLRMDYFAIIAFIFIIPIIYPTSTYGQGGIFQGEKKLTLNNATGIYNSGDNSIGGIYSQGATESSLGDNFSPSQINTQYNDGPVQKGPPGPPIGGEMPLGHGFHILTVLSLFYMLYTTLFRLKGKIKKKRTAISLFILLIVSLSQAYGQAPPAPAPPPISNPKLLFWDDFGGDKTTDPKISLTALPSGTTNLLFVNNFNQGNPDIDHYALAKNTQRSTTPAAWWGYTGSTVFNDHTYGNGTQGYMMVINADDSGYVFYTDTIWNLCPNTHLYFRAYAANLVTTNQTYINKSDPLLVFIITDLDGNTLATSTEITIPKAAANKWTTIDLPFNSGTNSAIVMKIQDLQTDTNGNDLLLDDIEVWLSTPTVHASSLRSYCQGDSLSMVMTYNADSIKSVFGTNYGFGWLYTTTPTDTITKWKHLKTTGPTLGETANPGYYLAVIGDPTSIANSDFKCCVISSDTIHVVYNPPSTVYWNGNANDRNWNNPGNWQLDNGSAAGFAPSTCNDVHIPGNSPNYPSLDIATSKALCACNDIRFHFGGLIGKPHLLKYHDAYVQYNFGFSDGSDKDTYSAEPMKRGRWYALAAPLQKMASGDFSVGGYPNFWQQSFETSHQTGGDGSLIIGTEWYTPENPLAWDIGKQNNAIAIWAGENKSYGLPGEGPLYQKNLDSLGGIFEMPYFNNPNAIKYHRGFSQVGNISYFQYYYYDKPNLDLIPDEFGTIIRGDEAYRFIFEGPPFLPVSYENGNSIYTMNVSVTPPGVDIMVGNPFMSYLDFDAFATDNGVQAYSLYVNSTYESYSVNAGSYPINQYIAPLQAFFLNYLAIPATLTFNADNITTATDPNNTQNAIKLKSLSTSTSTKTSSNVKADVLYLNAASNAGQSWLTLSMQKNVSEKNLHLLAPDVSYANIPQIYATDNTGQKNMIQFEGGYNVKNIPFGVLSKDTDMITLTVYNIENFASDSLTLLDQYLNKTTNLKATNSYTFQNVPSVADRFLLILGSKVIAGITPIESTGPIHAYVSGNTLYINAPSKISDVSVIALQGITVIRDENIGQMSYTKSLSLPSGLYIISAKLATGETKVVKVRI